MLEIFKQLSDRQAGKTINVKFIFIFFFNSSHHHAAAARDA
jgi:hypothetical protein